MAENCELLMLSSRILSRLNDHEQALYDHAMDIFTEVIQEFQYQEIWDDSVSSEREELLAKVCECGGELEFQALAQTETGYCDAIERCKKCGKKVAFKWDIDKSAWSDIPTVFGDYLMAFALGKE